RPLGDRPERLRVLDREIGQHLTVEVDLRFLQPGDELVVRKPVRPSAGVDAHDPEPPERPLLVLAVAIRVRERVVDLLLRVTVGGLLQPPVALCLTEHLAPLFARRNRTLHAWHQRLPLLPSRWRMVGASTAETGVSLRKPRFRFDDFFVKLWLFIAWRRSTFPPPGPLNPLFTLLPVFVF